jgi:copper(I)-binding protein
MQGDVMRIRALDNGLEIKPGQTVELKPGGLHLMFLDLQRPLKEGETVKGTLVFEKAGTVEVEYAVRALGARGGSQEHQH